MTFSSFDRKRIATVFHIAGKRWVFRGTAHFETDAALGRLLRIKLDDADCQQLGIPDFAVVLQESKWQGEFLSDHEHGCDYLVDTSAATVVSTAILAN